MAFDLRFPDLEGDEYLKFVEEKKLISHLYHNTFHKHLYKRRYRFYFPILDAIRLRLFVIPFLVKLRKKTPKGEETLFNLKSLALMLSEHITKQTSLEGVYDTLPSLLMPEKFIPNAPHKVRLKIAKAVLIFLRLEENEFILSGYHVAKKNKYERKQWYYKSDARFRIGLFFLVTPIARTIATWITLPVVRKYAPLKYKPKKDRLKKVGKVLGGILSIIVGFCVSSVGMILMLAGDKDEGDRVMKKGMEIMENKKRGVRKGSVVEVKVFNPSFQEWKYRIEEIENAYIGT